MAQEDLLVSLGLQDKGVNKQITAINKELRFLDKEFKTTNKTSKDFENTTEGLTKKLSYLEKTYNLNNTKLEAYKKKMEESKEAIKKKQTELDNLTSAEEVNEKAVEKAKNQLSNYQQALRGAEQNIALTEAELQNLTNEIGETNNALNNKSLENYQARMKTLSDDLQKTADKFNATGDKLKSIGSSLTLKVTAPILAAGGAMVKVASDAGEMQSKFDTVFKTTAKDVEKWAKDLGGAIGRSSLDLKEAVANSADLMIGMGMTEAKAGDLSERFIELAYDLGSFNNVNDKTAVEAMTKAMMGETEMAKSLGVNLSVATMEQSAYVQALGKKWSEMTQAEKAEAYYAEAVKQSSNAIGDAARTSDSFTNQSRALQGKLKDLSAEMGEKLVPVALKLVESAGELLDKFLDLDDATQTNIIKMAGFAAVVGPATSVLGSFTKGIGGTIGMASKLVGKFATVTTATTAVTGTMATAGSAAGIGAVSTSLGAAAVAAAPWVAGAAAIGAAGYGIYKTMSTEVVPSIDLFSDVLASSQTITTGYGDQVVNTYTKISEATKTAVSAYNDLDYGATESLNNLYINSTLLTEETCTNLKNSYSEMGTAITTGLTADKANDVEILNGFFATSTSLSEEEKNTILANNDALYASKEATVTEKTAAIQAILENAKNANRELTQQEMTEIGAIQQEMKTMAVQTLSENELEANAILERMKANDTRITAEQSAQHIQTLNASRDQAVGIANSEYDERIKAIIRMRDESGTISAEQAQKMIQDATTQKDGIITQAEETRMGAIEKMRTMNSELDEQVDTSTGGIVTKWDKMKRWWSGWKPEKKSFESEVTESRSSGGSGASLVYSLPTPVAISSGIPTTLDMPTTFDNMIVSGGYYTPNTSSSQNIVRNINDYTIKNQANTTDFKSLGDMIVASIINGLKDIKLDAQVDAYLDTERVSSQLNRVDGRNLNLYGRFNGA